MEDVWARLKHFTKSEKWGDPDLIDPFLLLTLDAFREKAGIPFQITWGSDGTHAEDSKHYPKNNEDGMCHAVDVIFPTKPGFKLPDLFICATRFPFSAIGLYPYWTNGAKEKCGGMHLETGIGGPSFEQRKLWMGVLDSEGKQIYEALTLKNLILHCPAN